MKIEQMKPGTKNKIMAAVNEELRAAGLPLFNKTSASLKKLIESPIAAAAHMKSEELLSVGIAAGIVAELCKRPEPSKEEMEKLLTQLKKFRYEIRPTLKQAMKNTITPLLRKPGPGRTPGLTIQEKKEVIDYVGDRLKQDVSLKDACKLAAQKWIGDAKSYRTIQRAWQKRRSIMA